MPWFTRKEGDKWCVHKGEKSNPGPKVKCYDSKEKAEAYVRALYSNYNKPK